MKRKTFTEGTRVIFRTKESRIRAQADPVVEWEGGIDLSSAPGFATVLYKRRDGSQGGHTIGMDEVVKVLPAAKQG